MFVAVMFLFLGAFAVGARLLVSLRRWGLEDARTDARLHSPEAHTLAYVVPAGQDPARLRGALGSAGFVSVIDAGESERVLVECEPGDHALVSEIIEHVRLAG